TLISHVKPASIVPGALSTVIPLLWASPDRGVMEPTYPLGICTAIPVGTRLRPSTGMPTSSAAWRSSPASVECALTGSTASGCKRFICNDSKVFVSLRRLDPPCLAGPVLSKFESFASCHMPVVHERRNLFHMLQLSVA